MKNTEGTEMNLPDIGNLNEEQLKALHTKISKKIYGFWAVMEELLDIEKEEEQIRKYVRQKEESATAKSDQIQALKAMGFNIVIHDHTANLHVSIMNYSLSTKGKHYSLSYDRETNTLTNNKENPVSDEDVEKIKEILGIK